MKEAIWIKKTKPTLNRDSRYSLSPIYAPVISIQQPASNCANDSLGLRKSTGVDKSLPVKILRLVEALITIWCAQVKLRKSRVHRKLRVIINTQLAIFILPTGGDMICESQTTPFRCAISTDGNQYSWAFALSFIATLPGYPLSLVKIRAYKDHQTRGTCQQWLRIWPGWFI